MHTSDTDEAAINGPTGPCLGGSRGASIAPKPDGGARSPGQQRGGGGSVRGVCRGESKGSRGQGGGAASVVCRAATGDERRDRGWDALAQIIGLQCLGGHFSAGQRITVVATERRAPLPASE